MSPAVKDWLAGAILVIVIAAMIVARLREASPKALARFCMGVVIAGLIVLLAAIVLHFGSARARDLGQWQNTNPRVHQWYQELMRPDSPASPCCTEADAYWADEFFVRNGKMYARITDDRPDAPLGRPHIDNGSVFEVPSEKLKYSDGNPTGHGVLFVSTSGYTWCYVQPGGV